MSNRYDITLDSVGMRIVRGADGVMGYRRRMFRPQLQRQDTNVPGVLSADPNRWSLYQSSWARGSTWWKPSVQAEPNSYYTSKNLNLWRSPGQIEPWNVPVESVIAWNAGVANLATLGGQDMYAVGNTTTVDNPNNDIYKWTSSTATWAVTAYSDGLGVASKDAMYDPVLARMLVRGGSVIHQWTGAAHGTSLITLSETVYNSFARMFLHDGRLFVYTGDKLVEVSDRTGSPTEVVVTDDGFGPDWMTTASSALATDLNLATPTAEGVYYVKNVEQGSTIVAYVFRVERDAAGNWNSVPIATLPSGTVALSIGYHLGSVVISGTSDSHYLQVAATPATGSFPVTLYHVTGGNLGTLGMPLGVDVADETPYEILMADGPYLYIGGQKRIWVYDAIRGGVHPFFEFASPSTTAPCRVMARVSDGTTSPATPYLMFWVRDAGAGEVNQYYVPDRPGKALATVTAFGDDLTTYVLESNYFDFDTPMEDKGIVGVHILSDPITANAKWTLYVSVDDGAFTLFTSHSEEPTGYAYTSLGSATGAWTGKRFRYKLVYETKTATEAVPIRALMFIAMPSVSMADLWQLRVDGTEFVNVDGKMLRPYAVYVKMLGLASTGRPVTLVDNFISADRSVSGTYAVMVQSMEIQKDQPGEAYIDLVLERTDT